MELAFEHTNWLDVVFILIIVWGGLRGYHRGLARTLLSLTGLVIAFPAAGLLTPQAAAYVNDSWQATPSVAEFLERHVALPAGLSSAPISTIVAEDVVDKLRVFQLPEGYIGTVGKVVSELGAAASTHGVQTIGEFVFFGMAAILVNTLLFILLFALVRGLFALLTAGMAEKAGLGMIGVLNRLAGMATGMALTSAVLMTVLGVVSSLLSIGLLRPIAELVSNSMIAQRLLNLFYLVTPWIRHTGELVF